jgi:hypothetical protein
MLFGCRLTLFSSLTNVEFVNTNFIKTLDYALN